MGRDVIIALDFSEKEEIISFLDRFGEKKPFLKVGMELYYSLGNDIIKELKKRGHKIFLDLKLHDIPNTVKKAMKALSKLDVDIVNLHASGTTDMMKAALEGLVRPDGTRPLLIAVTLLTSISEARLNDELHIDLTMEQAVVSYALNAKAAGLDGVVCSPLEAETVKRICGNDFLTVTPGIRFATDDIGDQSRITDPKKARDFGCDYIVVGRSITGAKDPLAVYDRCISEFIGDQTEKE